MLRPALRFALVMAIVTGLVIAIEAAINWFRRD
jgi:hypothetical protein